MVENQQNPLLGKIAAYTEILATDPRSTIFVSLSESYRKMGMLDEALAVALKGLDQLPDYGPGHVVLARIKCQQGDMLASEASFKKALDIDSDSLAALVGYSRLCLLLGNIGTARNLLLTARELSPADSVINKLLLSLPEVDDQPVEAVLPPKVEKLKLSEPQVEPLETATLADLYLKQGMIDQALNIYQNLLKRDPDNLAYRRRIRDIELTPNGISEFSAEPASLVEDQIVLETNSADTESGFPVASKKENIGHSNPPVGELSVLDQLNCLLVSINKRRGDV